MILEPERGRIDMSMKSKKKCSTPFLSAIGLICLAGAVFSPQAARAQTPFIGEIACGG
jgi:hypothetical protein